MGEGMSEAELRELVQGTVQVGFWFLVIAGLLVYLVTPAVDGGPRRWYVWRDRVKGFLDRRRSYVEPHDGADDESAARTGADDEEGGAPHQDAGAHGAHGAGVRAEPGVSPGSLVLTPAETGAVARMVSHKVANPKATKLDTIKAGWPEVKARSGDPQSRYARASEIYEAVFNPPPILKPVTGAPRPPGQLYAGENAERAR